MQLLSKRIFFVISEDDKRDQHFTHYVQKKVSEYLLRINYNPKVMHEFNDGCVDVLATTVSELGYESVLKKKSKLPMQKVPRTQPGCISRERWTYP